MATDKPVLYVYLTPSTKAALDAELSRRNLARPPWRQMKRTQLVEQLLAQVLARPTAPVQARTPAPVQARTPAPRTPAKKAVRTPAKKAARK
jgi:hypothetical protein